MTGDLGKGSLPNRELLSSPHIEKAYHAGPFLEELYLLAIPGKAFTAPTTAPLHKALQDLPTILVSPQGKEAPKSRYRLVGRIRSASGRSGFVTLSVYPFFVGSVVWGMTTSHPD